MALRAWYPLNGNVNNQGIGNFELTQTTAPTWATGITCAQALNSGAYKWVASQTEKILNNTAFSYAAWIYVGDSDTRSMIFGNSNTGAGGDRWFSLFQYPTKNDFHASWIYNDSGSSIGPVITGALPTGKWTHIAAVYKVGSVKLYVNGVEKYSNSITYSISSFSKDYNVIYNNANHRLQDVRIYDHALSVKEVRELAKGLMVHYTLDDPYATGMQNFYSGVTAQGKSTDSSFTVTKLTNEDGYNFKLTRTGTGSSNWPQMRYPGISRTLITPGKKYVWSAKVRCNKWTAGSLGFRNAICVNDYTHGSTEVCKSSLADGQWHQYIRTYTITEGLNNGTTYYYITDEAYNASTQTSKAYVAPRVEFCSSDQKTEGTIYDMDFDVKDVQLIEADEYPGFIDNSMSSSIIRDNSGHGNDGTLSTTRGELVLATPRNSASFKFFNDTYISLPDPIKSTTEEFTISLWFNTSTVSGSQCIWNGRTTQGKAVAIFIVGSGLRIDDDNQSTGGIITVAINTWYHLVVTWKKGGNKTVYVNGIQKFSVAASSTLSKSNTIASIGMSSQGSSVGTSNPFKGMMSDYRIYATALSADDVVRLYNAPISISKAGEVFSSAFDETASKASFRNTGVVTATEISECYGKFDSEVRFEPDGSAWMRISHHADPTTYLFSESDPFPTQVYKDSRRFFHGKLPDYADKWEFMVLQKANSSAETVKYRWVQSKNPNAAAYADVAEGSIVKNTSTGYSTFAHGGIYKKNSGGVYWSCNTGSASSWWGGLGCWANYQGGIPAWNKLIVTDGGFIDLYIRLDGGANWSWPANTKTQVLKSDSSVVSARFDETK